MVPNPRRAANGPTVSGTPGNKVGEIANTAQAAAAPMYVTVHHGRAPDC